MIDDSKVSEYFLKADKEAVDIVEKQARKALKEYPELDEFIMAQGTWFFTRKNKSHDVNIYSDLTIYPLINDLYIFISKWDKSLQITGEGIRFTCEGKKIVHW